MKRVAYQGVKGAFSHLTALQEFGEDNHYVDAPTFRDVFELVEREKVDYAVIPIENSLAGSVYENYDLLNEYDMHIVGEHYTKVEHCLLVFPNGEQPETHLRMIKRVMSHAKALEQCANFLRMHPWIEAVVYRNTAAAAAKIAAESDTACAAIASASAAELYGLQILKKNIEDDPNNYTRFVIIAKNMDCVDQVNKCSLLLRINHVPGALAGMLMWFGDQGINLTKIESRPFRESPFEYLFYVDFEFFKKKRAEVEALLRELDVPKLKVLGFYGATHPSRINVVGC